MFGLFKPLFRWAEAKPAQWLFYAAALALVVGAKVYSHLDVETGQGAATSAPVAAWEAAEAALNSPYEVAVSSVIDGDTFKDEEGQYYRIAFIDAPESNQDFGNVATAFLKNLIENKQCTIETVSTDKYGRIVAKVYINGLDVAALLVEFGFAHDVSGVFNADKEYSEKLSLLEGKAQEERAGLWSSDDVKSPYEFRQSGI